MTNSTRELASQEFSNREQDLSIQHGNSYLAEGVFCGLSMCNSLIYHKSGNFCYKNTFVVDGSYENLKI